jgi:hypothetical protein
MLAAVILQAQKYEKGERKIHQQRAAAALRTGAAAALLIGIPKFCQE